MADMRLAALVLMEQRLERLHHALALEQAEFGFTFIGHHPAEAEIVMRALQEAGNHRLAREHKNAWRRFYDALHGLQDATLSGDRARYDAARRNASWAEDEFERVNTDALAWIRAPATPPASESAADTSSPSPR
jgi:hypothetical protein